MCFRWLGKNLSQHWFSIQSSPVYSSLQAETLILVLVVFLLTPVGCTVPNRPPVAVLRASPTTGDAPLLVTFDISSSYDPDGVIESFKLDFGDETSPATGRDITQPITHTYSTAGTFTATLTVSDNDKATNMDSVTITVITPLVISGVLAVSDIIENIGVVDPDRIPNPLYRGSDIIIWQVTPALRPSIDFPTYHLEGLNFYAKLQGNSLSILIKGDEAQALRGMIPSLEEPDGLALCSTPDINHFCYSYERSKTLIYRILQQAFDELREGGAIAIDSSLKRDLIYQSTFTDKVYVIGYYIAASEYDANYRCFHNWPWGNGTDECIYFPGAFICEYTDGIVEVNFNFDISHPNYYYTWGEVYNDNGEETIYTYNDEIWLHQVDWARPHHAVRYGSIDFPSTIKLWLRKTWSTVNVRTWIAIVADSINVEGSLRGEGPTVVNRSEELDVLVPISIQQGPIQWP